MNWFVKFCQIALNLSTLEQSVAPKYLYRDPHHYRAQNHHHHRARAETYSHYKSHNTVKFLMANSLEHSYLYQSGVVASQNRNRNETEWNGIGMQARTISHAAVTQLHQDHMSPLGLPRGHIIVKICQK